MAAPNFPALSRKFKIGISADYDPNVIGTKMDDGLVITWPAGSKVRRTWQITATRLTAADKTALDNFFRVNGTGTVGVGGHTAFNISIPGTAPDPVLVRFTKFRIVEDTQEGAATVLYALDATVEEV